MTIQFSSVFSNFFNCAKSNNKKDDKKDDKKILSDKNVKSKETPKETIKETPKDLSTNKENIEDKQTPKATLSPTNSSKKAAASKMPENNSEAMLSAIFKEVLAARTLEEFKTAVENLSIDDAVKTILLEEENLKFLFELRENAGNQEMLFEYIKTNKEIFKKLLISLFSMYKKELSVKKDEIKQMLAPSGIFSEEEIEEIMDSFN